MPVASPWGWHCNGRQWQVAGRQAGNLQAGRWQVQARVRAGAGVVQAGRQEVVRGGICGGRQVAGRVVVVVVVVVVGTGGENPRGWWWW